LVGPILKKKVHIKKKYIVGCWWLTPVILATQEADISRILVQSQPRQIVLETLSQKKNRASRVAQGDGPEFKPHYHKAKQKA
jgi:hypothetical protein